MKFSVFPVLSLLLASASAGSIFKQVPGRRESVGRHAMSAEPVPGDNPFLFCDDSAEHTVDITRVDLDPNPLVAGMPLRIKASGTVKATVLPDAAVDVTVKYGLITMLRQKFDICENADQVDMECPIKEGKLNLEKSVDIPRQIPPGKYTVMANATNFDGSLLTCIMATVSFYP